MSVLYKIIVSGIVQGVGFRYFVYETAKSFNLKGYTRNLFSGEVEIEVEGDEGIINAFIKEVKVGPRFANVTNILVEKSEFTGKYHKFEIRH
jgi:acylphosphatase